MNDKESKVVTQKFFWAVRWNFVEAVLYQILFVVHQTALFASMPTALFGLVGSLFSMIYVAVTFLVAGSDGALTPYFSLFTHTRTIFNRFLFLYTRRQVFTMTAIFLVLVIGTYVSLDWYKLISESSVYLLIIIAGICVSEAIKKICRYLLQLCFENKAATVYEVLGIASYVSMVWTYYWYTGSFTLISIFAPYLISSIFVVALIIRRLKLYSNQLPSGASSTLVQLPQDLGQMQFLVMANQLGRTLFSGNVIIPLLAAYAGTAQAGLASFANAVTHTATFFIQKLSVPPGAALLVRMQGQAQEQHHKALKTVLSVAHALAFAASVGVIMYGVVKGPTCCGFNFQTVFLFGFFFFIHVLENLFMVYEKYFLIQRQTGLLVMLNGGSILLCAFLAVTGLPFFMLITACFLLRLGLLGILHWLVFAKKRL